MLMALYSPWDSGPTGILIEIECQVSNGLPGITIIGYANKSVDEAKERLRSAFSATKLQLPRKRITINLAPADIPKESSTFDVAIAASILRVAQDVTPETNLQHTGFIGEIGLTGTIRPVRGVIGKILAGKAAGLHTFVLPAANLAQAQMVPHVTLIPLKTLGDLVSYIKNPDVSPVIATGTGSLPTDVKARLPKDSIQISDIVGQPRAKRALEIAAAGGHNILLNGPPGTGKSMLAKALPSILPPLSHAEILEITHLHSLAAMQYDKIVIDRPFRAPHHSASHVAVVGGGHNLRPGEITLSHLGVLFFDELPEFSRTTIEALRQPLEDRSISIARARESITYPANFILVTTSNPCPCGYYNTKRTCRCSAHEIQRYRRKLSGPILDRIDLYVEVDEVHHEKLLSSTSNAGQTDAVRHTVAQAREAQHLRYKQASKLNADMTNRDIKATSHLSAPAKQLLDKAATTLDISARSYMRTIKVARTIADLEQAESITTDHISESLQYRSHNYNAAD